MKINTIIQGDALEVLKTLPDKSVDMVMTSPPYWALRDYGVKGQLGLELTFYEYINKLCDIFDEVKRVLKKEGTCWVNLSDTYGGSKKISKNKDRNDKDLGKRSKNFSFDKRNKRTVRKINPKVFSEAHFAVFPEKLCWTPIKAGCPKGGIVLDMFGGAMTTAVVAKKLNRNYVMIELNPEYIKIGKDRLRQDLLF